MILFWLAVAVVMGGTVGFLAQKKGRSALLWGLYGLALNVIALVHVILLKPLDDRTWTPMRFGVPEAPQTCPNCGASVRGEAVICRHCRQPLYRSEAGHQPVRQPAEVYQQAAQSELPLGESKPQPEPHRKAKAKVGSDAPSWLDESFARMSWSPEPPPAPEATEPPKAEPEPQPVAQVRVETRPEPRPQFQTKIEPTPEPVAQPMAAKMREPPKVEATSIEPPTAPEPKVEEPKVEKIEKIEQPEIKEAATAAVKAEPSIAQPAQPEAPKAEPKLESAKIEPKIEPVKPPEPTIEAANREPAKPEAATAKPALSIFATARAAFERPRPAPTVEPRMRIGGSQEPKPHRRPTLTADNVRAPLSSDSRSPKAARDRKNGISGEDSHGTLKKVVGLAGLAALIGFLVPFAATFWPNIKTSSSQIASSVGTGTRNNATPPTPAAPAGEDVAVPQLNAPQSSNEQSAALTPPSSPATSTPPTPEAKAEAAPSASATPKKDAGESAPVDLTPPAEVAKPAPEPKKAASKPHVQKPLTQEEFAAMVDRALQKESAEGGAGGDAVLAIQQKLRDRGYDPGSIDGRTGPKTVQAIRAFQRTVGMKPDGKIDMALMERLGIVGPQINAFTENKR